MGLSNIPFALYYSGMKGMAESVTDILSKAGVFEGRILTNF